MDMRKRIYYHFPKRDIHFEQKYRYYEDLPYLVRTMAGLDGVREMFTMESPDRERYTVKAKREIATYIVENNLDFARLSPANVDAVLVGIESDGMLDFKISLKYSRLDEKYKMIASTGDDYLVRMHLDGDLLTLAVHLSSGPGRTECRQVVDGIVEALRQGTT
ncbi:MAG: hypothetical protein C5S47_01100 [Candidatus Methanogasteraceae archaeon]|nr:MAG: hypothetical protein C5S47_01100 [ANME-2 cluster archaeon]